MRPAVILLSGGIDSTTTLAIAKSKGFDIYAISFNYGQRHFVELDAAKQCAAYFNVKKHLIINFDLREIGGSALTSDIEVPKDSYKLQVTSYKLRNEEYSELNSSLVTGHSSLIPVTYVPARNTIFLSFALSWAEVLGAEDIFIGANAVDYSGYPDCRPEFISAFENMANLATKASVEGTSRFKIHAPLISLTKGEIIKKGIELGVDYSMTWSCYDPQPAAAGVQSSKFKVQSYKARNSKLKTQNSKLVPCMRCDSCLLRAKGFKEAGIKDPLLLKVGY